MKRFISFSLVFLLVVSCLLISGEAMAAAKKVSVRIVTQDPATGQAIGGIRLDLWKVEQVDHGTTEECVKEIRTNARGEKTVSLTPGSYHILVSDAPAGYADYTATEIVVKREQAFTVNVLPLLTCRVKVLDHRGKPVEGAEVSVCEARAWTNKNGIATLRGVEYGKPTVQVAMYGNEMRYIAYEQKKSVKAEAGQTIRKTVRLSSPDKWKRIEFLYVTKKPIIYLYSKEQRDVRVQLGKPENLTVSYPRYPAEKGWDVTVHPDGSLTDRDTGRTLYCLYWEGNSKGPEMKDTGFVVSGPDTLRFLEEKLADLGLTAREAEEFIIYWLPEMQKNAWNYIRFATEEEIRESMPLSVTPEPDHVIRVWMEFTALTEKINLPEQEIRKVNRDEVDQAGFYVVEWGGTQF